MAQAERRAKAVLAAAVEWHHRNDDPKLTGDDVLELKRKLDEATGKYEEAAKALANLPEDPGAFLCPHCGAVKPGYGWNYNAGDTGPFAVAYLTVFCGACKNIISVCVTTFMPAKEIAEAMKQQFDALLSGKGKIQA